MPVAEEDQQGPDQRQGHQGPAVHGAKSAPACSDVILPHAVLRIASRQLLSMAAPGSHKWLVHFANDHIDQTHTPRAPGCPQTSPGSSRFRDQVCVLRVFGSSRPERSPCAGGSGQGHEGDLHAGLHQVERALRRPPRQCASCQHCAPCVLQVHPFGCHRWWLPPTALSVPSGKTDGRTHSHHTWGSGHKAGRGRRTRQSPTCRMVNLKLGHSALWTC